MNAKFELEIADQNIVVSAFRTPGGTTELFELNVCSVKRLNQNSAKLD